MRSVPQKYTCIVVNENINYSHQLFKSVQCDCSKGMRVFLFSSIIFVSFNRFVFFPFFRFLSFCFSVRREGSTTGLFSYAFPSKNNIALAITTNAQ